MKLFSMVCWLIPYPRSAFLSLLYPSVFFPMCSRESNSLTGPWAAFGNLCFTELLFLTRSRHRVNISHHPGHKHSCLLKRLSWLNVCCEWLLFWNIVPPEISLKRRYITQRSIRFGETHPWKKYIVTQPEVSKTQSYKLIFFSSSYPKELWD